MAQQPKCGKTSYGLSRKADLQALFTYTDVPWVLFALFALRSKAETHSHIYLPQAAISIFIHTISKIVSSPTNASYRQHKGTLPLLLGETHRLLFYFIFLFFFFNPRLWSLQEFEPTLRIFAFNIAAFLFTTLGIASFTPPPASLIAVCANLPVVSRSRIYLQLACLLA